MAPVGRVMGTYRSDPRVSDVRDNDGRDEFGRSICQECGNPSDDLSIVGLEWVCGECALAMRLGESEETTKETD